MKTPAEFEEGFRSYGAKGFDLAFGHGFEFQDAALKAGWAGKKDERLKPTISPATLAEVARLEKEIKAGTFTLPRGKF